MALNINDISHLSLSGSSDDEQDFIPIITFDENDEEKSGQKMPEELPILPLRNTVLFPGIVIPITVGRDKSIRLIKEANAGNKTIGVVSQKDVSVEDPEKEDLNTIGTVARILKMLRMPDGNITVIIQGKYRFQVDEFIKTEPYIVGKVSYRKENRPRKTDREFQALISTMKDMALETIQLSPNIPSEAAIAIKNIESPTFLVNFLSSNLQLDMPTKQSLLEIDNLKDRANDVLKLLIKEFQMLELKNEIHSKVKVDIDKQQREFYLHQQLKTIQEELGGNTPDLEVQALRERGKAKKWSKEIGDAFNKELDRMQRMNSMSPDYSVLMNYVELMLDLPWNEFSNDSFDINKAEKILEKDHFGLEKIKQRILEYLSVLKLKSDMKAPILCFVGPPGVGKTSLGKSIATALGRKYARIALGGVRDESTIRGHRRTYIGALPGRIIQTIKKVKSSNPVIVLDEIDKVGVDFRGDISSALLEVLDPEQNKTFYDHYLELDYDLSKVLFIATANSLSTIQPALLDRMEIIDISGYTLEEKVQIAKKFLVPKQLEAHGITSKDIKIKDAILEFLIDSYTRESGVRTLDKRIAAVVRGAAKNIAQEKEYNKTVTPDDVRKSLGTARYEQEKYHGKSYSGVVTGLAWTSVGGDILYIETSLSRGKGRLTLTGNLGDVMKESASIALAYIKAHCDYLKIDSRIFEKTDIHIHVPEGATPKDGPSAGITMFTSLVSAFKQNKIKQNIAMTGEITLRGKVLPVGGIKEKILAAKRAGITDIVLSYKNKKDIDDIKKEYISDLNFHFIDDMFEVVDIAIINEKVKNALPIEAWLEEKTTNSN